MSSIHGQAPAVHDLRTDLSSIVPETQLRALEQLPTTRRGNEETCRLLHQVLLTSPRRVGRVAASKLIALLPTSTTEVLDILEGRSPALRSAHPLIRSASKWDGRRDPDVHPTHLAPLDQGLLELLNRGTRSTRLTAALLLIDSDHAHRALEALAAAAPFNNSLESTAVAAALRRCGNNAVPYLDTLAKSPTLSDRTVESIRRSLLIDRGDGEAPRQATATADAAPVETAPYLHSAADSRRRALRDFESGNLSALALLEHLPPTEVDVLAEWLLQHAPRPERIQHLPQLLTSPVQNVRDATLVAIARDPLGALCPVPESWDWPSFVPMLVSALQDATQPTSSVERKRRGLWCIRDGLGAWWLPMHLSGIGMRRISQVPSHCAQELLDDPNPSVRRDAVRALAALGAWATGAIPDLLDAADEPAMRDEVREAILALGHPAIPALEADGRLHIASWLPLLDTHLQDGTLQHFARQWNHAMAHRLLHAHPTPAEYVASIHDWLCASQADRPWHALRGLGEETSSAVMKLVDRCPDHSRARHVALFLAAGLEDCDVDRRLLHRWEELEAAEAQERNKHPLHRFRTRHRNPALELKETSEFIQWMCSETDERLLLDGVQRHLATGGRPAIRLAAVFQGIGKRSSNPESLLPVLVAASRRHGNEAGCAFRLEGFAATPSMVELIGHASTDVRDAANLRIRRLGSAGLDALELATRHPSWRVRHHLVDLLASWPQDGHRARAVAILESLLLDPQRNVRDHAFAVLQRPRNLLVRLAETAADSFTRMALAEQAQRVLHGDPSFLRPWLTDASSDVRRAVIGAIMSTPGSWLSASEFDRLRRDACVDLRAAAWRLRDPSEPASSAALVSAFSDPADVVWVEALRNATQSTQPDPQTLGTLVRQLGAGPRSVIDRDSRRVSTRDALHRWLDAWPKTSVALASSLLATLDNRPARSLLTPWLSRQRRPKSQKQLLLESTNHSPTPVTAFPHEAPSPRRLLRHGVTMQAPATISTWMALSHPSVHVRESALEALRELHRYLDGESLRRPWTCPRLPTGSLQDPAVWPEVLAAYQLFHIDPRPWIPTFETPNQSASASTRLSFLRWLDLVREPSNRRLEAILVGLDDPNPCILREAAQQAARLGDRRLDEAMAERLERHPWAGGSGQLFDALAVRSRERTLCLALLVRLAAHSENPWSGRARQAVASWGSVDPTTAHALIDVAALSPRSTHLLDLERMLLR